MYKLVVSGSTNITEGNMGMPTKGEESNGNIRLEVIKSYIVEKRNHVEN